MALPTPLRALNHRDYRPFRSGQVVSQIGSWMQVIGHSWLILQLTVIGAVQALFYPATNTIMLVSAPDALRGRVMSLFPLANAGVAPVAPEA
ncbi:MAG: hypothetical protein ACOY94_00705 [Bacillota bacterium]